MFSNRTLAIETMEDLLAINTIVNASLLRAQKQATQKEYTKYRKVIAKMIGLSFDVLPEIWRNHPEICPKEFRQQDS